MRQKHPVFAILRVDDFHGADTPIEAKVTVKQVVSSQEIAEREVERLTCEKGCRYFWQTPRFVELPEEMGSERV